MRLTNNIVISCRIGDDEVRQHEQLQYGNIIFRASLSWVLKCNLEHSVVRIVPKFAIFHRCFTRVKGGGQSRRRDILYCRRLREASDSETYARESSTSHEDTVLIKSSKTDAPKYMRVRACVYVCRLNVLHVGCVRGTRKKRKEDCMRWMRGSAKW